MKIGDRVRGGAGAARDEIGDVIFAIEKVPGWERNGRLRNARVRLHRARTQIDGALRDIGPDPAEAVATAGRASDPDRYDTGGPDTAHEANDDIGG